MKRFLMFFGVIIGVLLANLASSQVAINISGGLNISSMKSSFSYSQKKAKAGINLGVTADIPIIEPFGIQTGLIYSTKGERSIDKYVDNSNWWAYDTTTYKTSANLNYLVLPLKATASWKAGNTKFIGSFGPYLGLGIGGKVTVDETRQGNTITYTDYVRFGNDPMNSSLRRFDYGLTLGLGLNNKNFHMGLSYDLGLKNLAISRDGGNFSKNRSWSIEMGYRFGIGNSSAQIYKNKIKMVNRLKSQEKLLKVALEDEDWRVRQAAVIRITNQNYLYKVVINESNIEVKLSAFNLIADQNLINQLATECSDANLRLLAVEKVIDQNLLFKIVQFDNNNLVKIAGINNINDQDLLFKIAQLDSNKEVSIKAFNKITDQNLIIRVATEFKEPSLRKLAIKNITDESIIYKIALDDLNYEVKYAAMNKISSRLLAKLADDLIDPVLKLKVVDLLNDQMELLNISQNNDNWDVRKAAFTKLNDNSLDILTREAKDPALALSSKIRLGRISWIEAFSGKGSSTETLGFVIGAAALVDSPQPTSYDVVFACHNFIQLGDASRIPELIFLLNKFGDVSLAEDYMNCGESTLEEAGCKWGRAHGYECTTGYSGSNRVRWGSKK